MENTRKDRRIAGRRSWRTLVVAVALLGVGGMASQAAAAPSTSAAAEAAAKPGNGPATHTSSSGMHTLGIRW